jgi:hypothetical protein
MVSSSSASNAAIDVSDDELLGLHLASALLGPSNVQEQTIVVATT